jgi:hypothetical protein
MNSVEGQRYDGRARTFAQKDLFPRSEEVNSNLEGWLALRIINCRPSSKLEALTWCEPNPAVRESIP